MKKILLCFILLLSTIAIAQNGTTREQAISLQPQTQCDYTDFTTQGSEMWFKFVAQQEKISIELKSEKFGHSQSHVHQLKMFRGSETIELVEDELPFNYESEKLRVNLNAGNLVPGETYYLKAERKAKHDDCDKAVCKANNSTNAAQIKLCVQNVYPYIPNDYYGENPNVSHGYELHRGQIANLEGQVANSILAFANHTNPEIYLGDHYNSFVWPKIDDDSLTHDSIQRVDMRFSGGNLHEKILYADELKGHTNYYVTHNQKGILNNKSYSRVIRQDLYPNIDLQYYSNHNGVKMYFVVYPDGDPNNIKFSFEGNPDVSLTSNGGIKIRSALGEIAFKKAIVYSVNTGGNNVIMPSSGTIIQLGNQEYGIQINGNYPKSRILVIQLEKEEPAPVDKADNDPEWATYVGGSNTDYYTSIDADDDNKIYLAGTSKSSVFPTFGLGIFSAENLGNFDVVVSSFESDHERNYSTYFGGNGEDVALDIAYDAAHDVNYITGLSRSSSAFPLMFFNDNISGYQDAVSGQFGSFISRLNDEGGIEWSTGFIRSNTFPTDHNIAVDATGNVYVGGRMDDAWTQTTCSAPTTGNFPSCNTVPGSHSSGNDRHTRGFPGDAYLAKFDLGLNLVWSTVIGGEYNDEVTDLVIDNNRSKLIVIGGTESKTSLGNCPTTYNGFRFPRCNNNPDSYIDETYNGPEPVEPANPGVDVIPLGEAFLMEFTLDGVLEYSTLIGGNMEDLFMDVDIDNAGNIYAVGTTQSLNSSQNCWPPADGSIPVCHWINGSYVDNTTDNMEIFVAKFNPVHQLVWSTFLGGSGKDAALNENHYLGEGWPSITVNEQTGDFYVAGTAETGSRYGAAAYQYPTVSNEDYYNQQYHSDYVQNGPLKTEKFVTHFTSDLRMDWSTYFGGKSSTLMSDFGGDIITKDYKVYLCGGTTAIDQWPYTCPNIPGALPYCQGPTTVNASFPDAFVAQLVIDPALGLPKMKVAENLLMHPNPSNSEVVIQFNANSYGDETIHFTNQIGQTVYSHTFQAKAGQNEIKLELESLAKGIYVVTLEHNSNYKASKWVKL
ncbi:MAG: T9SS type A sorting domain-containing protein [Bacteroidota bacterium]